VTRRLVLLIGGFAIVLVSFVTTALTSSFAAGQTLDLALTRQTDMSRFATLADQAFETGDWRGVQEELRAYDRVYGVAVDVLDNEGRVQATSRRDAPVAPEVLQAGALAAQGLDAEPSGSVFPWTPGEFVAAIPVGADSQTFGAVVTVSPLDDVRHDVGVRLAVLAGAALVVLAVLVLLLSLPVALWVLRPVHALQDYASRVAAGSLDEQAPGDQAVPEMRSLAASFDTMLGSVKHLLAAQQQFADHAAHQLRNPLTALRLSLESVVAGTGPGTPEGRRARSALLEVERLSGIADGLLDLSRAGSRSEPARPLDATAVVESAVARWQPVVPGLAAHVANGLKIYAAPGELEQVLDVLLDNAGKYAAGSAVFVRAAATADDGVAVCVEDAGPGISEQDQHHVGSRFWRAPGTQNQPGAGLGLSIARQLVDRAGGRLTWSSSSAGFAVRTWWPSSDPLAGPVGRVEVDERRVRDIEGGEGAHHTHDLVLRATRLG